jgi:hypothetical protein
LIAGVGPRGLRGALESLARRVPLVIAGKMPCGAALLRALRELPDAIVDRREIDVGEGELIVDEMAPPCDRPGENTNLLAQRRHDGVDCHAVIPLVRGLRGDVHEEICPDQVGVDHRVSEPNPPLGELGQARIGWEDARAWEAAIEISRDGLRFDEFKIIAEQHCHLSKGMEGNDLGRV